VLAIPIKGGEDGKNLKILKAVFEEVLMVNSSHFWKGNPP